MPGVTEHGKITIERIDERLKTGDPFYLFNIYNLEHKRNTGSTGEYFIPACPAGKEWVRGPQTIPGTVEDIYPHFEEHEAYRVRAVPGEDIVKAILEGGGPQEDIRRFGVFASNASRPTKDELAEAKKRLVPELQRTVREADEWSVSADPVLRGSIGQKHYDAANFLNVKRGWMSVAEASGTCIFCGSPQKEGVPVCSSCQNVTNQALYDELKAKVSVKS